MSFFRDTSISSKILIPPIIMTAALGAVLLLAIHGFNKQGFIFNDVYDIALEKTTLVNEFISLSESVQADLFRIAVLRFMNLPEKEIQPIHEHLEQGLSDLRVIYGHILDKWPLDQEEKELLQKMKIPMDAFQLQAQQATAAVSENPSFGILMVRSAAVPFADFRSLLTELLNEQKKKIVHAKTVSKQTAETVKTTTTAIAIFTALIAILGTVWIGTRLISSPIRWMTIVMGQLAGGDLSKAPDDLDRKDEIGSMSRALDVFRENAIEKQAAEKALRESENRLRATLDATPFPVAITDLQDDKIFYWSRSAIDLFGHTAPTASEWYQIAYPDPNYRREVIERWKSFLEIACESGSPVNTGEYRVTCKDGSVRICELYATFLPESLIVTLSDITERKSSEEERDRLISNLQQALSEVKTLRGFLPICSHCKKIRDDKGYWNQIESYIHKHSDAEFSHGICPECAKKYYPDIDLFSDEETQE